MLQMKVVKVQSCFQGEGDRGQFSIRVFYCLVGLDFFITLYVFFLSVW